jgi:DNA-binding MarR family transcriptional regulator
MQPMCAGTLARELRLSQGTVTGILGRLENRALIHRTRGTQDRRSVRLELTDAGAEVVAQAPSLLQDRFREELSRLQPWERTMILATLQRIAAMMDPEDRQAEPVLGTDVADAAVPSDHDPFAEEASAAVGAPAWEGASEGTAIRLPTSDV